MLGKKIAILLSTATGSLLLINFAAAGVISGGVQTLGKSVYGGEPQQVQILAALILNALFGLLGIVAVAMIIYGGFLYMTSQGKEDQIKKAKNILITAAIGLVIIFSAFAIANYIINVIINAQQPS